MRELTWNLLYLRWLHWSFHRRKPGLTSRRSNPDLEGRTGPSFRQSESAPQTVQIEKHDKSTPKSRHTENHKQDITKVQYIVQHITYLFNSFLTLFCRGQIGFFVGHAVAEVGSPQGALLSRFVDQSKSFWQNFRVSLVFPLPDFPFLVFLS